MRFGIKTIDDIRVEGKTVLLRVDINQPVDRERGTLKDTTRIRACVPTIRELSDKGAKVVLLAHQGSDIEYKNYYTTKPHALVISELLGETSNSSTMSAVPPRGRRSEAWKMEKSCFSTMCAS